VAIVPLGLVMRRTLPETFHAASEASTSEPASLRPHIGIAVLGVMLLACNTIGNYIDNYMTTYAITTLHMRVNVAFAATIVVGLSGVIFDLISGSLSDRIGRKKMMIVPGALLLISILPAFYLLLHFRTAGALLGATALLSTLATLSSGPTVIWVTESLPIAIRSSGVAIVYAVSIATFGGTTQYVVTWLIKLTGSSLAPAWYWTGAMIVGLIAMSIVRESAPRKLHQESDKG
jgi:MFS transporter, MHS family, citrate/tricarballylate:H+ symporter